MPQFIKQGETLSIENIGNTQQQFSALESSYTYDENNRVVGVTKPDGSVIPHIGQPTILKKNAEPNLFGMSFFVLNVIIIF